MDRKVLIGKRHTIFPVILGVIVIPIIFAGTDKGLLSNKATREITLHVGDKHIVTNVLVQKQAFSPELDKLYFWYQNESIHKNKGGYSGFLLHGVYEQFNQFSNMLCQGSFSIGCKVGNWKYWYANGQLKCLEQWTKGKRNGLFRYYSAEGDIDSIVSYKKDVRIKRVSPKDTVSKRRNWKLPQWFRKDTIPEPERMNKVRNPEDTLNAGYGGSSDREEELRGGY